MTIHTYYITYCVVSNLNSNVILCGAIRLKQFSPSDFRPQIRAEIALISARILVENRSAEISDRKLPISASVRHGYFLPSGNRQFPRKKRQHKKRSKLNKLTVSVLEKYVVGVTPIWHPRTASVPCHKLTKSFVADATTALE